MNAPATPPPGLWTRLDADQRRAAIQHAIKMGHSRRQLSITLGTSQSTIESWAKNHGVKLPTSQVINNGSDWVMTLEPARRRMFELAQAQGGSAVAIGKILKTSHGTILKYARRHGIKLVSARGANLSSTPRKPRAVAVNQPVATRDIPPSYATPNRRPPPDTPTRVHVLDHKSTQCRFPLWPDAGRTPISGMFYCGAPVDAGSPSYCPSCRQLIKRGTATLTAQEQAVVVAHMHRMRAQRQRGNTRFNPDYRKPKT